MVASWNQATVFLASCARKSRERNGKKANEFLPLGESAHAHYVSATCFILLWDTHTSYNLYT